VEKLDGKKELWKARTAKTFLEKSVLKMFADDARELYLCCK